MGIKVKEKCLNEGIEYYNIPIGGLFKVVGRDKILMKTSRDGQQGAMCVSIITGHCSSFPPIQQVIALKANNTLEVEEVEIYIT